MCSDCFLNEIAEPLQKYNFSILNCLSTGLPKKEQLLNINVIQVVIWINNNVNKINTTFCIYC